MSKEDPKPLEAVFAAEDVATPHLASIMGNEVACSCGWKSEVNGAEDEECKPFKFDDIIDWIEYGQAQGWISPIHCATHDGVPYSVDGAQQWEEGYDPCEPIVRLWQEGDVPAPQFVIAEDTPS